MIKKYFEKIFNNAAKESVEAIFSLLEENPKAVLLDCGCGEGVFTKDIMAKIKCSKKAYGIEIAEESCKKSEAKGIIVYRDDLNSKISLNDGSVDVVFCNQVIEHLSDTDKFISEVYRVLKPNGYAVVATENLSGWHNIFALILGWQPFSLSNISSLYPSIGNIMGIRRQVNEGSSLSGFPKFMQHLRVFAPKGLKEIFEIHGFKCEKFLGSGYYPFFGFISRIMSKLDLWHTAFLIIKIRKLI